MGVLVWVCHVRVDVICFVNILVVFILKLFTNNESVDDSVTLLPYLLLPCRYKVIFKKLIILVS